MAVVFTPLSMIKGDTKYIGVKLTGNTETLTDATFSVKNSLEDDTSLFEKPSVMGLNRTRRIPNSFRFELIRTTPQTFRISISLR